MKNLFFTTVIFVLTLNMNAQKFGLRAGADFATAKAKFEGYNLSENETGFYIGAFTILNVSESFKLRPEVNYISIQDLDQIQVPILAEIGLADKFNALAGPSFGFLLDSEEGSKSFNFGLDFGLSYDITEQVLVEARYSLGLSNLFDDNYGDATLKLHGLFVGIGYMF